MKVFWTLEAQQDRNAIWEHIVEVNPQAAIRLDERFDLAASSLAEHPMLGRPGHLPGTRELIPHENYRLIYEIGDEAVWILALVHVARRWPPFRV